MVVPNGGLTMDMLVAVARTAVMALVQMLHLWAGYQLEN